MYLGLRHWGERGMGVGVGEGGVISVLMRSARATDIVFTMT